MNKPGIWTKLESLAQKMRIDGGSLATELGPDTKLLPWISNNPNLSVESLKLLGKVLGQCADLLLPDEKPSSMPFWYTKYKAWEEKCGANPCDKCPPIPHLEKLCQTCCQKWAGHQDICSLPTWPLLRHAGYPTCFQKNIKTQRHIAPCGSQLGTVLRFCSAERPPTTSARWYLRTQLSGALTRIQGAKR